MITYNIKALSPIKKELIAAIEHLNPEAREAVMRRIVYYAIEVTLDDDQAKKALEAIQQAHPNRVPSHGGPELWVMP